MLRRADYAAPSMPRAPTRTASLKFIVVTLVLDVLGFGLLIPVGPRLVESLLHGGAGGNAAEAAPQVAMLMTTWYAMSFLFAPILGSLSDRVGRRPVLLIALFGSGLDFFAQALAPTLAWLYVTRAINGLSGASITVANAYIADVTPPEKRAAAFGMAGAAFGIGFVIGPLMGGMLGAVDIRLPFYVAGGLTLANWLYGLIVLPESLPRDRRRPFSLARANPLGALGGLGRYPAVAALAASLFLANMAQFALHATWVLYTSHRYGWNTVHVGLSLFTVGVTSAIVQGGLARKIIPRIGEKRSLIFGLALSVFAFAGYGLATHGWMIYTIIVLASLGGIAAPAAQSIITRAVLPTEQGEVQGALASLNSIAGIIGPLIGGSVLAYALSERATVQLPGLSFLVCAAIAAVSWAAAAWAVSRSALVPPDAAAETPLDRVSPADRQASPE